LAWNGLIWKGGVGEKWSSLPIDLLAVLWSTSVCLCVDVTILLMQLNFNETFPLFISRRKLNYSKLTHTHTHTRSEIFNFLLNRLGNGERHLEYIKKIIKVKLFKSFFEQRRRLHFSSGHELFSQQTAMISTLSLPHPQTII